jgi:predicted RNA polymerase sigma factor
VNPPALYDALNCASLAVLLAESGDANRAEAALLEASLAASEAFPVGSPEAEALGVILTAAGRVSEVTA